MSAPKIEVHSRTVRAVVSLSLSADDWALYSLPGRDEAAELLNREIEAMLAEGAAPGRIVAVLSRPAFSRFGASDTEPRGVLFDIIRAATGAE